MTVLVTGGAGYIGSHTVRLLRERGRDVVVLDSMEFGHRDAVFDTPLVVGAIDDAELVQRTVADHGVESVIHFAAYKAAGESMEQPSRYLSNNVGGTNALLDALRLAGVDKVVFSSTCAVYGTPTKLPVDEEHPLGPESPYGESKRMVEQMLGWYDTCHDLRSVSLRYFNAAGARPDGTLGEDHEPETHLIPLVLRVAAGQAPSIKLFGTDYPTPDGTCIRDYIHVDDLASAHLRALDAMGEQGACKAFNLGTGRGYSVREIVQACQRVTGREIPVEEVARRPGDPAALYADNSKVRRELGWSPVYNDVESIVTTAWLWHAPRWGVATERTLRSRRAMMLALWSDAQRRSSSTSAGRVR
jgi:UDP-glucose-4-epimerase GalE